MKCQLFCNFKAQMTNAGQKDEASRPDENSSYGWQNEEDKL